MMSLAQQSVDLRLQQAGSQLSLRTRVTLGIQKTCDCQTREPLKLKSLGNGTSHVAAALTELISLLVHCV